MNTAALLLAVFNSLCYKTPVTPVSTTTAGVTTTIVALSCFQVPPSAVDLTTMPPRLLFPSAENLSIGETPTGTVDGTNAAFTLAHAPVSGPALYVNGLRQKQGVAPADYTLSGATVTFNAASVPSAGSFVLADYRY